MNSIDDGVMHAVAPTHGYSYSKRGLLLAETSPRRGVTAFILDEAGQQYKKILADGTVIETCQLNTFGDTVAQAEGRGFWTLYKRNRNGFVNDQTFPGGSKHTYTVTPQGHVSSI